MSETVLFCHKIPFLIRIENKGGYPAEKDKRPMDDRVFMENINRIRNHDREGLREIYEAYNPMIFSVILNILKSRENSEDVAVDFFIHLWDAADSYRPGNGHRAWMITIARNMALDYLRKHAKEELTAEIPEDIRNSRETHETKIVQHLSLTQALSVLSPEEREMIDLKILGELSFREIADILKTPQGTVASRYRTAIRKLKEVFQ